MRTSHLLTALTALLVGCTGEYAITGDEPVYGMDNPRELENTVNEDRIVQVTVPETDVLFVVDNSSSMLQEQADLADAFPKFLEYFLGSGLDYHIGVVSTDMRAADQQGKLQKGAGHLFIDPDTPDPMNVFTAMANLGNHGDGNESGRAATYAALELRKEGYNEGFYREDASAHVIVMSDEHDWSDYWDVITQAEFIEWYSTLKPDMEMVTFNSIVNRPDCCGGQIGTESAGLEYIEVTNSVGGIFWDIKDGDWDLVLDQLGMQAAGLQREFYLTQLPVPESISVVVVEDGVTFEFLVEEDWTYTASRNSIVFSEFVPSALSEIQISYDVWAAAGSR